MIDVQQNVLVSIRVVDGHSYYLEKLRRKESPGSLRKPPKKRNPGSFRKKTGEENPGSFREKKEGKIWRRKR